MISGPITSQPVCVAPTGDRCGEGAVWHAAHSAVYWTDINRFLIHRFTLADRCVRTWFFDVPVTAITLTDRDDVLAVVLGSGVILWEPETDLCHEPIYNLEGWPTVRFNDARVDPRGSLWVGSMRNNVNPDGSSGEAGGKDGILYRIDPDACLTIHRRDVGISNTLAWNPDRRRFYFADSLANTIWAYDYDRATGTIANERVFFANYERGLQEILRILKPGGATGVLEFAEPPGKVFGVMYRFYFRRILPILGGMISGNASAYTYLPNSVSAFPSPEELKLRFELVGFVDVRFERWTGGIVTLHTGVKSRSKSA